MSNTNNISKSLTSNQRIILDNCNNHVKTFLRRQFFGASFGVTFGVTFGASFGGTFGDTFGDSALEPPDWEHQCDLIHLKTVLQFGNVTFFITCCI